MLKKRITETNVKYLLGRELCIRQRALCWNDQNPQRSKKQVCLLL